MGVKRNEMILKAIDESGLSEDEIREIRSCLRMNDHDRAKEILHSRRKRVSETIAECDRMIHQIDWMIYYIGKESDRRVL